MTMIMFNDYDDDDNYHCYNGNVLSITFFYTILEGLSKPNIEKFFYAMMKCCAQNSYACTTTYEFNAILALRFVLKTLKLLSRFVSFYFNGHENALGGDQKTISKMMMRSVSRQVFKGND